jgi:rhodanese-related sulfurtransferase
MQKKWIVWGLAAAIVTAVAALLLIPGAGTDPGAAWPASKDITNAELTDLVARGARLIDVRTAAEFAGGHIEGAENVPVDAMPSASAAWDKAKPVVVYCQVGSRSLNAVQYLRGQGFSNVYDLTAGIARWDGAVVKGEGAPARAGSAPVTSLPTMYDFSSDT